MTGAGDAIDWRAEVVPMDPDLVAAAAAADGFLPSDEGAALYEAAVRAAPLGPLLEIGTYCGKSAIHLAAAARTAGMGGGHVVTIDHHRGSEEHQPGWEYHDPTLWDHRAGRLDTLGRARATLDLADLADEVVMVVAGSVEVGALWERPLGLVFIDGGHTEQAALADYETWAPHVAPGGLLVIHDVFEKPAAGGQAPFRMWRRAVESGRFDPREHAGQGSLRVLQRDPTGPPS